MPTCPKCDAHLIDERVEKTDEGDLLFHCCGLYLVRKVPPLAPADIRATYPTDVPQGPGRRPRDPSKPAPAHSGGNALAADLQDAITEALKAGRSARQVAEELGVAKSTVQQYAYRLKNSIPLPYMRQETGPGSNWHKTLSPEKISAIKRMKAEGASWLDIKTELHVGYNTIGKYARGERG